jgi:cell division protein FtsI (penicillin-binding protein 3)
MRGAPRPSNIFRPAYGGPPAGRLYILTLAVLVGFGAVAWQLASLAQGFGAGPRIMTAENQIRHAVARPDAVDRNGLVLASDVRVYWLFADPSQVLDVDETLERLSRVLKASDLEGLRDKLTAPGSRFVWVKRGLTPRDANAVHNLGLPGLYLLQEPQRVYPAGSTAVHVLGHTNVDNEGLAGIEKYIDAEPGAATQASEFGGRQRIRLSLDLRLQHAMHEELAAAKERFQAKGVGGIILDVASGEVLAMGGLPDYDPNRREEALQKDLRNRLYYDTYEMGSVFKTMTIAMGLDAGVIRPGQEIDVLTPLHLGHFTLVDRHAKSRYITVEDVFTHSSNTGAARIALQVGAAGQKAFLEKMGLLHPMTTELGPTAHPQVPDPWRNINTMTAAYGHGISVPPFSFAVATAALVNGGFKIEPTFLPRSRSEGRARAVKVLTPQTSAAMRRMFWLNVEKGTGKRAKVEGYRVGGKTGTAWKPAPGGYSHDVITSFVAAFPMDDPQYLVLVVMDEPQVAEQGEKTEAGYNAAPTAGNIIRRIGPMLGIAPSRTFDELIQASY